MLALEDVPFGPLADHEIPERTTFDHSVVCADCVTDRGQVEGRTAYRDVLNGVAVGSGTSPQLLDRYRPSNTSARSVVVRSGQVHIVKDPTTVTASDGAQASLGTPFASSANISGAQLNDSYYLGADEAAVAMRRIVWDGLSDLDASYSLATLQAIPQGAVPVASQSGALTWTAFSGLATRTVTGCTEITPPTGSYAAAATTWRGFALTAAGNDDPLTGAKVEYKLAALFDATGFDWLSITASPHDSSNGPAYKLGIYVAADNAGSPGAYTQVGTIYDFPPQAGSPNLVYCYLAGLPAATLAAIRWIKIQLDGPTAGKWMTYGYMFLPAPPTSVNGKQTYYVDCYDSVTGQASPLTQALDVTTSDAIVSGYPNSYMGNDVGKSTGGTDAGIFPINTYGPYEFHDGNPVPSLQDIGALVTVRQTLNASWIATQVLRLWKATENGIQLVTSHTLVAGDITAGFYDLVDPGGLAVLRNQIYKAGGVPPRCSALASFAGRLIAGYQNRFYVSSFTPTSTTSNPFPQFPDVPVESADGWSADLASKAEIIQQILAGDMVYMLTSYGLRVLTDVDAPLFGAPSLFHVGEYGAVSRTGAMFAEDGRLFWVSYDGIYVGQGRTEPVELSQAIRSYIVDTFQPDSTCTIGYQDRCLHVWKGTLGLRYDFISKAWSTLTTAHASGVNHSIAKAVSWSETITTAVFGKNMWILTSTNRLARWQATVSRDLQVGTDTATGEVIPDWSFSTGFRGVPKPSRVTRFSWDVTGADVRCYVAKDMSGDPEREVELPQGEMVAEAPPDIYNYKLRLRLEGANAAKVRRLLWGVEALDTISP